MEKWHRINIRPSLAYYAVYSYLSLLFVNRFLQPKCTFRSAKLCLQSVPRCQIEGNCFSLISIKIFWPMFLFLVIKFSWVSDSALLLLNCLFALFSHWCVKPLIKSLVRVWLYVNFYLISVYMKLYLNLNIESKQKWNIFEMLFSISRVNSLWPFLWYLHLRSRVNAQ
jgi:hypothetical protein